MKKEKYYDGQDIFLEDHNWAQCSKEEAIKDRTTDLYSTGVIEGLTISVHAASNDFIDVLNGKGYDGIGERLIIRVSSDNVQYNPSSPSCVPPASTGNRGVPLFDYTSGIYNYVWIKHSEDYNVNCFSVHPLTGATCYARDEGGYSVTVDGHAPEAGSNGLSGSWINLGCVQANGTGGDLTSRITINERKCFGIESFGAVFTVGIGCATTCFESPYVVATTCLCGPVVCGTTCVAGAVTCGTTLVQSPTVYGSTLVCGATVCGVTCVVSPTVYGSTLVCGATVCGVTCVVSPIVCGINSTSCGIVGVATSGCGVRASATTGVGVYGIATGANGHGVFGCHSNAAVTGAGVFGNSNGLSGVNTAGVIGCSTNDYGVLGCSSAGVGVFGQGNNNGVVGCNTVSGAGVRGDASGLNGCGVHGVQYRTTGSSFAVLGEGQCCNVGVYGWSCGCDGVRGCTFSASKSGVYGEAASGYGVFGISTTGYGVAGCGLSGVGVYGSGGTNDFQGPGSFCVKDACMRFMPVDFPLYTCLVCTAGASAICWIPTRGVYNIIFSGTSQYGLQCTGGTWAWSTANNGTFFFDNTYQAFYIAAFATVCFLYQKLL